MAPMKPITTSKRVAAYGYEPATQTLSVQFKHSAFVYHYQAVPPKVFEGLEAAESKGSFIAQQIVKGGYVFDKVDTAADDQAESAEPAAA